MAPLLRIVRTFEDNPAITAMLQGIEAAGDNDHMLVKAATVPRGVIYRFELQEGVIGSLGSGLPLLGGAAP